MGVYIKGVTRESLLQIFQMHGVIHNSADVIEVPTPHGDLIDVDEITIYRHDFENEDLIHRILDAPTVIEAEDGE